jgi:outer membrane biosynthesis protein TonB
VPAAYPIRWQSERRTDSANKRLAMALVVSLVLHGLGYATWRVSPAIAAAVKSISERVLPRKFTELQPAPTPKTAEPKLKREVPMVFVEVDPAQATPEPPKETKNYSTHNSIAANPEPKKMDVPKIDGTQKHVQRTTDNEKPQPKPLQPAPLTPKAEEPKPVEPTPPPPAQPKIEVGDLAMVKKTETKPVQPEKTESEKPLEKPRKKPTKLSEVLPKIPALAGMKIQQDGGTPTPGRVSLSARGTDYGEYDRELVRAVQQVWWQQIEEARYNRHGMVKVAFVLHSDGRVSNLEVLETTVDAYGATLCQIAIDKPKNYGEWPKAMLQQIGKLTREVTFTFYYD